MTTAENTGVAPLGTIAPCVVETDAGNAEPGDVGAFTEGVVCEDGPVAGAAFVVVGVRDGWFVVGKTTCCSCTLS